jgi:hypothetical protein
LLLQDGLDGISRSRLKSMTDVTAAAICLLA